MSRHTTILVVEDVETTRRLIRQLLVSGGYHVIEASDAGSALYLIHEHKPALTLLDVHLPDMSGLELAALIKGHPFAILTADQDEELFEAARRLGSITYFVKPLQRESFLRQIDLAILQNTRVNHLQRAMHGTRDIAKAIGLLIGTLRVSEEAAFELLSSYASRKRIRSGAVADQLLELASDSLLDHAGLTLAIEDFFEVRLVKEIMRQGGRPARTG